MPLVTKSIPNLINGVSQQPSALRLASQAEKVVNCIPSPVEGLKKRPPFYHKNMELLIQLLRLKKLLVLINHQ